MVRGNNGSFGPVTSLSWIQILSPHHHGSRHAHLCSHPRQEQLRNRDLSGDEPPSMSGDEPVRSAATGRARYRLGDHRLVSDRDRPPLAPDPATILEMTRRNAEDVLVDDNWRPRVGQTRVFYFTTPQSAHKIPKLLTNQWQRQKGPSGKRFKTVSSFATYFSRTIFDETYGFKTLTTQVITFLKDLNQQLNKPMNIMNNPKQRSYPVLR